MGLYVRPRPSILQDESPGERLLLVGVRSMHVVGAVQAAGRESAPHGQRTLLGGGRGVARLSGRADTSRRSDGRLPAGGRGRGWRGPRRPRREGLSRRLVPRLRDEFLLERRRLGTGELPLRLCPLRRQLHLLTSG